jgi:hypothetical protein
MLSHPGVHQTSGSHFPASRGSEGSSCCRPLGPMPTHRGRNAARADLPTAPVLVPLAHCLGLSLPPRTPSTQKSATATNRAFEMRDIRGLCRNSPDQSLSSGENDSSRLVRLPISGLLTNDANADVVACRGRCWRLSRYGDAAHEMRQLLADRAALRLTGVRLRGRGGAERVDFVCEHLGQCCESS